MFRVFALDAGAFLTAEEELLLDAANLGILHVTGGMPSAASNSSSSGASTSGTGAAAAVALATGNSALDVTSLIHAADVAGITLDFPAVDAAALSRPVGPTRRGHPSLPSSVYSALAAKPRSPPHEWVMTPPAVDPFSIPENDEGEEA